MINQKNSKNKARATSARKAGLTETTLRNIIREEVKTFLKERKEMAERTDLSYGLTNEARSWGTYPNKEGKKVNSTLDKEFDKFLSALEKANADWQNAVKQFTTGTSVELGMKSGIQDSEGKYAVSNHVGTALKKVFGLDKFGEYSVRWMFENKKNN